MDKVVIVLGYGCHLNENITGYLFGVADYLYSFNNINRHIITTGGFTNEVSAPGVSEAAMMADYLKKIGVKDPIHLEERARTTPENFIYTAELLGELGIKPHTITIFGCKTRKAKIMFLAKKILGKSKCRFQFKGHDFKQSKKDRLKQYFIFTPADIFGFYFPVIESVKLHLRGKTISRS